MKAEMNFRVTSRSGRNYAVKIPCEVESLDGLPIKEGWVVHLREMSASGYTITMGVTDQEETPDVPD